MNVSAAEVEKQTHSHWNQNLQTHIDEVQQNKHLSVYYRCFLSTSLK